MRPVVTKQIGAHPLATRFRSAKVSSQAFAAGRAAAIAASRGQLFELGVHPSSGARLDNRRAATLTAAGSTPAEGFRVLHSWLCEVACNSGLYRGSEDEEHLQWFQKVTSSCRGLPTP